MLRKRAIRDADQFVVTFALAGDDPWLPAPVVVEFNLTNCVLVTWAPP